MTSVLKALADAKEAADWLGAVEITQKLVEFHPDSVVYRYELVLAYAKAGAPHLARQYFDQGRLGEHAAAQSDELRVDILCLHARLLKDAARSDRELHEAGLAYAEADATDPYPLVNAATLFALSGDMVLASEYARRAELSAGQLPPGYWREATRAEALLILGDSRGAMECLAAAVKMPGYDHSSSATTRKQLRRLLTKLGRSLDPLEPLQSRVPATIHYVGRRFVEHLSLEPDLAENVRRYLQLRNVQFGFGSLAAGSDIVVAEALLERQAELTIVLPYNTDEFVERSVSDMGESWERRFYAVFNVLRRRELDSHRTFVHFSTKDDDRYFDDDLLYGYSSRFAMGLATLQARALFEGPLRQLAIWNGEPEAFDAVAGTSHDVAVWNAAGGGTDHLSLDWSHRIARSSVTRSSRETRAMMFGDFQGFSKLGEAQLVSFVQNVLGGVAEALRPFESHIIFRNTWGDGIFLVHSNAESAARCALALQNALAGIPLESLGFPKDLRLRLGVHFGPIRRLIDPVTGRDSFFGEHVSRTARIEPVALPGEVYATEQFSAELALCPVKDIACEFVGYLPLAKQYMASRLYMLRSVEAAVS